MLTLEVLVEIERVGSGVLPFHIGRDDVQIVQIHCRILFRRDLLLGATARVRILGRVGASSSIGRTLFRAVSRVVPDALAFLLADGLL